MVAPVLFGLLSACAGAPPPAPADPTPAEVTAAPVISPARAGATDASPVAPAVAADPLASWKEGATKQAIVAFVARVTA